jgi:RNA polymerase sigma-70 factor (ECF subfamily)
MESGLPQQILVEKARNGDQTAFEQLFRQTHQQIFNFLLALELTRDEAADVTQETFVKAWESLGSLRSEDRFLPWLYQIARNKAKDHIKARSRKPAVSIELVNASALPERDNDPAGNALKSEKSSAVYASLLKLPEHQKLPVIMHHIHGMPVADIAKALGVSFGTVLSRLARGRAALARSLTPYMDGGGSDSEGTREL